MGRAVSKAFTPREYQQIAHDFMLDVPRSALLAGMGTGKTVSTLTLIDTLHLVGWSDPILVLGPKRVARDTWPEEGQKWDHLKHMIVVPVIGTPAQRRAALRTPGDVYTMNYENLPWLVETIGKRPWPFRMVVADEATRLKGYRLTQGGERARALAQVARHTERWVNLTGTPASNGLKDLWGQYWFLDFGDRLGRTHSAFMARWFHTKYSGFGVEPNPGADDQIYSAIDDITLSINPKDWFDIDDPIEKIVTVHLPPAARKRYQQLEKDMFTELECGTAIEAFNAAALTNKCRQLANGAVYTENPAWIGVHDEKLEALDSIVSEANGASVLVAYDFVSDRERILAAFKNAVDISKPAGYKAFISGEKQIGVAHPKSMGHGIDGLQDVCNILVYFGHDWNLEERMQILERIGPVRQKQSGYDRPVWVYSIVAEGTLDEVVLERHKSKRLVQDLLLEAMKGRKA